jgi:hypothetical protein
MPVANDNALLSTFMSRHQNARQIYNIIITNNSSNMRSSNICTQNYLVSGLHLPSGILEITKHNVSETGSFPSSGRGGGNIPTQLGPLERANLNHWISC